MHFCCLYYVLMVRLVISRNARTSGGEKSIPWFGCEHLYRFMLFYYRNMKNIVFISMHIRKPSNISAKNINVNLIDSNTNIINIFYSHPILFDSLDQFESSNFRHFCPRFFSSSSFRFVCHIANP